MVPKDRKYLKTHEWALATGDSVTVGITEYAVKHLSDLVFLDLPPIGKKVNQGQPFGEIESVKAVSDLNCPVTGIVTEVNEELADHLERLNADPWKDGWMIKVKVGGESGLGDLLSASDYEALLEDEPE